MATPTVENYLKALLALADEEGKVTASQLGRTLGVSTPSVNSMVRKLDDRGLVTYERYQPLQLTEAGKKAAALVIRKHRLTEMYLVEKMGFGWEEVHNIAEQVEHVESTAFFDRMDELLGFPDVDPHGSPIPAADGTFDEREYRKLSECLPGESVEIRGLAHSSNDFLHYLNDRAISLNTTIHVRALESFDGSMTVDYGGESGVVLSKLVTDRLLVA